MLLKSYYNVKNLEIPVSGPELPPPALYWYDQIRMLRQSVSDINKTTIVY